jgi:hypothetical protein
MMKGLAPEAIMGAQTKLGEPFVCWFASHFTSPPNPSNPFITPPRPHRAEGAIEELREKYARKAEVEAAEAAEKVSRAQAKGGTLGRNV